MSNSKARRLLALALIYLAQGIPAGFAIALNAWLPGLAPFKWTVFYAARFNFSPGFSYFIGLT